MKNQKNTNVKLYIFALLKHFFGGSPTTNLGFALMKMQKNIFA